MQVNFKTYILLLICFYAVCVKAQNKQANEKKLIQFSGLVVTVANDSTELSPVPFASIKIKGSEQGTISDNAFFSFVAQAGDVIEFSALGYKTYTFKVPDTLTESKYSLIQVLSTDTIYFSETVITPGQPLSNSGNQMLALRYLIMICQERKETLILKH